MVPAKWRLVDFRQSETSSLIRVGDMSVVIVEVVEGSIATRRSISAVRLTADDMEGCAALLTCEVW
jgi:hypothetical protein